MSICLCTKSREKNSLLETFLTGQDWGRKQRNNKEKGRNVIYGKLVRKTLLLVWMLSLVSVPSPCRVPEPRLGEAGHTHCSHHGGLGAAAPWPWQLKDPDAQLQEESAAVSGCQLIFPALLLGAADRPACGVCCGVSGCCVLCPPWSHFPLISEHEVHSPDKMHLQCLIRVKELCVGNIPYTFICNSMLAATSPTGLQVTDESWSLLGSREAKYSRITVIFILLRVK